MTHYKKKEPDRTPKGQNGRRGMSRVVFWQMLLGSIGFLDQLIWAFKGNDPQWLILSVSLALLGGGTIQQIGKGGEDGR